MTIFRNISYLQKQRFAPRQILVPPYPGLGLVVVIPCHREPDLLMTLTQIEQADPPACPVEVIVVVNAGASASPAVQAQNAATVAALKDWTETPRRYRYFVLHFPALPDAHAGIGLARKIGMDEAVDRLEQAGNPQGIITCLHADASPDTGYLRELVAHFQAHPRTEAACVALAYETSASPDQTEGIVWHELGMRYHIQALRRAGHPQAWYPAGTAMAVRADAYQLRGGMNRRKTASDFHFLHKFTAEGTFKPCHRTTVRVSARPSDRIPFGAGKAVADWLQGDQAVRFVPPLAVYEALGAFLASGPALFEGRQVDWPPVMASFLTAQAFDQALPDMRRYGVKPASFQKRLLAWMDALRVVQYIHAAAAYFPEADLDRAARDLLLRAGRLTPDAAAHLHPAELLNLYRNWYQESD
ncbi:MAG: glycosyltransferase [Bacteroidia bacterium]|nr:glycosyltransferase [Bacteroidia bacterium]